MYVEFLIAHKIFPANWFNSTKKTQKKIIYGLKLEENWDFYHFALNAD